MTKKGGGIVHCQARATEIRDRALRVLELENSLGKFKKDICLRSGVWTTIKGQGMRRPGGIIYFANVWCVNMLREECGWVKRRKY